MDGGILVGFLSLGVMIVINLIMVAVAWGKQTQGVKDIRDMLNKHESRIHHLEDAERVLPLQMAQKFSYLEAEAASRYSRLESDQAHVIERLSDMKSESNRRFDEAKEAQNDLNKSLSHLIERLEDGKVLPPLNGGRHG
ncbi:MAG: hypothetical protein PHC43_00265 [Candidatus Marinimicrobia bacterium]|jgi:hypothetical protein|nr:hypothetical protein [Candidatus Neomarinimicrobiota bacterium]